MCPSISLRQMIICLLLTSDLVCRFQETAYHAGIPGVTVRNQPPSPCSLALIRKRILQVKVRLKVRSHVLWAGSLVVLLIFGAKLSESRPGPPDREQLVHLLGPVRVSEGRLTGNFPWAPFQRKVQIQTTEELLTAIRSLRRSPAVKSPEVLGDLGLLELVSSHPSRAVRIFERASIKAPREASLLNDLSAAHIAAWEAEGDPHHLVQALDIAQQALRIDPTSREARFNNAVTAERLHFILTARKAWEDFLDVETDPQWREEAEHRLAKLREPTAGERWVVLREQLEISTLEVADPVIREALANFPQQLRHWVQESLLERWAGACESGEYQEADRLHRAALSIGRSLAEQRGESSVQDAASAISQGSCERRSRLVAGHRAYARGVSLYNRSQYTEAAIPLHEAELAFEEAGSKAALLWTKLWLGGTEYYNRRHDRADTYFTLILKDSSVAKFPALQGRTLWCRGQLALVHGDFERALRLFDQAHTLFEALGETENAGAMDAMMADTLRRAGRQEEAWSERLQALRRLSQYPGSYRLHNLLFEAPDALLSEGLEFAAQEFQIEGARVAKAFGGKPSNIAANLLLGTRLRARWNEKDALSMLNQARGSIRQIGDDNLREAFWFESVLAEREIYEKSSLPQDPDDDLSKVIQYYEGLRQPINAAEARFLRARSEIQKGDFGGAEDDLAIGIGYQEAMAKEVSDQAAFAEEWQDLFEDMIRLHAVLRHDPERAFEFVERSRIPPCGTAAHLSCIRIWSLDEIRVAIPKGLALIEYFVLPERLLIWRFHAGAENFWEIPVDTERLKTRIESFVRDLQEGRDSEGGLILYDLLLRGPLEGLPADTDLVFVPDRALNCIPFAALRDRRTSRYLIEDHALGYELSGSRFLMDLVACNN